MSQPHAVNLHHAVYDALAEIAAAKRGQTVTSLVRGALASHLAEYVRAFAARAQDSGLPVRYRRRADELALLTYQTIERLVAADKVPKARRKSASKARVKRRARKRRGV